MNRLLLYIRKLVRRQKKRILAVVGLLLGIILGILLVPPGFWLIDGVFLLMVFGACYFGVGIFAHAKKWPIIIATGITVLLTLRRFEILDLITLGITLAILAFASFIN